MRTVLIVVFAFNTAFFLFDALDHPTRWSIAFGFVWPVILAACILEPRWMYWEVANDRIKHRHIWRYDEIPFGEIASVKPATGWLNNWSEIKPIEIRTVAGKKLKLYLSKNEEFLAELRNHVREEAFLFDEAQA